MGALPLGANRATWRIDLASHARERRMLRAGLRTRGPACVLARALVVVISAMALAACSNISRGRTISGTAYSKKFAQPRGMLPNRQQGAVRTRVISPTAPSEPSIEPKPAEPVPLPEAVLLSPQSEPGCEASGADTDERQKLDYERQCYRHAEMIVRSRLQLLQDSVGRTISAVKRNEWSSP
jgi:hypothetical protein